MPATIVQRKMGANTSLVNTGHAVTFDAPTSPGNTIVVVVAMGSNQAAVTAADDAPNGAYTTAIHHSPASGRMASILYFPNAAVAQQITATPTTTGSGRVFLYELSGVGASPTVLTGTSNNSSVVSAMLAADTGLSGTGAAIVGAQIGANSTITPAAGWTDDTNADEPTSRFNQSHVATFSSHQGTYTVGSATTYTAAMALFLEATAAALSATLGEPGIGGSSF